MTNEMKLFKVAYRPVGKGTQNAIVRAETKEQAQLMFNDPSDFTLNHEIKKVTQSMVIPKDWSVTTSDTGFQRFKLGSAVELSKATNVFGYSLSTGEKVEFSVDSIMTAVPPSKDRGVVKRGY